MTPAEIHAIRLQLQDLAVASQRAGVLRLGMWTINERAGTVRTEHGELVVNPELVKGQAST